MHTLVRYFSCSEETDIDLPHPVDSSKYFFHQLEVRYAFCVYTMLKCAYTYIAKERHVYVEVQSSEGELHIKYLGSLFLY